MIFRNREEEKSIRTDPMASSSTPPWEKLPPEITAAILQKLGPVEILTTAVKVCTTWRRVCRDPSMWRCIDLVDWYSLPPYKLKKMCRHAVDLSRGQLTYINIQVVGNDDYFDDDFLLYISQRSSQLKRLQLVKTRRIRGKGLIEAVKNLPLLEELNLHFTFINVEDIETIGRCCPLLKSFKLNYNLTKDFLVFDREALAIAKSFPGLRHLQLLGNDMRDKGLQVILEGCPNLESLDLRRNYYIRLGGKMDKLCSERIKDLRRPCDSIDDCEFSHDY